jgi:hypothetical protein
MIFRGEILFFYKIHDLLRHETDNPSLGLILCKSHDKITAEYALRDINKPDFVEWFKEVQL